MFEGVYSSAGFKGWMLAALVCAVFSILPLKLIAVATGESVLYMNVDSILHKTVLIVLVLVPITSFFSGFLNWAYEYRYNEEIFVRTYRHPENVFERIICVIGGALFLAMLPLAMWLMAVILSGLAMW